mgnify:FL=1
MENLTKLSSVLESSESKTQSQKMASNWIISRVSKNTSLMVSLTHDPNGVVIPVMDNQLSTISSVILDLVKDNQMMATLFNSK